ncbi:MAG: Glu-tRNA(Gln) amidotransferase subunit GatE [Conexivisphaera sp.]
MSASEGGSALDYRSLGAKVGIELHRQLDVGGKLFCGCSTAREDGSKSFRRVLLPSESELGDVDPAARFEAARGMEFEYVYGDSSSCLVEADEEPPHDVNRRALEAAITVALLLGSTIVDEVHVMRKIVIDGSNTSGFQRTMLIALGGSLKFGEKSVGVLTITLEEDAARNLGSDSRVKKYGLDRLGIPLVEVSLAPLEISSAQDAVDAAAALGRLLKSTGMVARGIGTVRQDLNVSIAGSGIVEVKGVQELPLIAKVVEFEVRRLSWLKEVAAELSRRGVRPESAVGEIVDVTGILSRAKGGVVRKSIAGGARALAVLARGYRGLLGSEPYEGVRVGRDLAAIANAFGLGGVIHSDELPNYGVDEDMVEEVRAALAAGLDDAFVIALGDAEVARRVLEAVSGRLRDLVSGPPAETRAPTPDGRTKYMRPRPGSARMYPETDLLPIPITDAMHARLRENLPLPWDRQVSELASRYGLSAKLADEVLDSERYDLFREAVKMGVKPSVAATVITETLVSLRREGLDVDSVSDDQLRRLFSAIASGRIAKEAASEVLRAVASGRAPDVDSAAEALGISALDDAALAALIDEVLDRNERMISERGDRALGPLMGEVMSKVRGRVDGAKVSEMLRLKLKERLGRSS